jgi:hypothetical protein
MDTTYLLSALQALFQPLLGDYSSGNVTVSTKGATPYQLSPGAFAVPVVKDCRMDDAELVVKPNTATADGTWTVTQAGIVVPVESLQGGEQVNLDAGTACQWGPDDTIALNDAVVAAGGLVGGSAYDDFGMLAQFKNYKDLGRQPDSKSFFAAKLGRYPAAVLSWSSTTPADSSNAYDIGSDSTRAGKTTRMFVHGFELMLITARLSSEDYRRREGDVIRDRCVDMIQDRMVWRDLPLCSGPKGLQISDARLLAVTDSAYIDVIRFGAMFGKRRKDWMTGNPWRTMSMRMDRDTSKGPKKTIDDKETVPQDSTPFDAATFRKHMRGEL